MSGKGLTMYWRIPGWWRSELFLDCCFGNIQQSHAISSYDLSGKLHWSLQSLYLDLQTATKREITYCTRNNQLISSFKYDSECRPLSRIRLLTKIWVQEWAVCYDSLKAHNLGRQTAHRSRQGTICPNDYKKQRGHFIKYDTDVYDELLPLTQSYIVFTIYNLILNLTIRWQSILGLPSGERKITTFC